MSLRDRTLREVCKQQEACVLKDEHIACIRDLCRGFRSATDRAVFFNGFLNLDLCIHGHLFVNVRNVLAEVAPAAEGHCDFPRRGAGVAGAETRARMPQSEGCS